MLQRGHSRSLFGKHGNGLEIVYTLSSRLMSSLPSYHIRLLTGLELRSTMHQLSPTRLPSWWSLIHTLKHIILCNKPQINAMN
ncbi:hypothetical protein SLE2022_400860 [Rubroshorea leprosula]